MPRFGRSDVSRVDASSIGYLKNDMNTYRKFFAATFAALVTAAAVIAAEVSPAGTWTWTQPGRGDRPGVDLSLVLEVKDGQLAGTMKGFQMGQFEVPDTPISDASFKDGVVKFSVTREGRNGNKMTSKYEAKLEGDTLKGSVERPNFRDGSVRKDEWTAKRAGSAAPAAKS